MKVKSLFTNILWIIICQNHSILALPQVHLLLELAIMLIERHWLIRTTYKKRYKYTTISYYYPYRVPVSEIWSTKMKLDHVLPIHGSRLKSLINKDETEPRMYAHTSTIMEIEYLWIFQSVEKHAVLTPWSCFIIID